MLPRGGGLTMGSSFQLPGKVFLVGSGPGSASLLTLRAHEVLRSADVVFHDDLVSEDVLQVIPPHVAVHSVGKRCGRKKVAQGKIEALLIRAAWNGQTVVRLKAGDPLIFGRAQEEMAALRNAGVRFEIIPGVTTASAAAAAAGIPLTDRNGASKLVFLSNHRAEKREPNWQNTFADSTLVVYMPGADLETLQTELLESGMAAETPFVAISDVAMPKQALLRGTIRELAALPQMSSPRLLIIGKVTDSTVLELQPRDAELRSPEKNSDQREVVLEIADQTGVPAASSVLGS
jgi:uroporphyrin-III C-methyltransferase